MKALGSLRAALACAITCAATLGLQPEEAFAVPAPDAAYVAELQSILRHAPTIRVRDAEGETFLLRRATATQVELAGLRPVSRASAITGMEDRPARIAWEEIRRVDRVQSNAGRGAVIGAVVLTSLATYWAVTTPRRQPNPYDPGFGRGPADYATLRATSVVIVMFSGAALGAAVGATMPRWHRILPR